jgi:hypothetical protein
LEINPDTELPDNTGEFPDEYDETEKEVIDSNVKVELIDADEQQSCSEVYFIYNFCIHFRSFPYNYAILKALIKSILMRLNRPIRM